MNTLFARHEAEFIENQIIESGRQTYHIKENERVYAFSKIRMGCKVPDGRMKSDYLFGPERVYRDHSTERKSHNWAL